MYLRSKRKLILVNIDKMKLPSISIEFFSYKEAEQFVSTEKLA